MKPLDDHAAQLEVRVSAADSALACMNAAALCHIREQQYNEAILRHPKARQAQCLENWRTALLDAIKARHDANARAKTLALAIHGA